MSDETMDDRSINRKKEEVIRARLREIGDFGTIVVLPPPGDRHRESIGQAIRIATSIPGTAAALAARAAATPVVFEFTAYSDTDAAIRVYLTAVSSNGAATLTLSQTFQDFNASTLPFGDYHRITVTSDVAAAGDVFTISFSSGNNLIESDTITYSGAMVAAVPPVHPRKLAVDRVTHVATFIRWWVDKPAAAGEYLSLAYTDDAGGNAASLFLNPPTRVDVITGTVTGRFRLKQAANSADNSVLITATSAPDAAGKTVSAKLRLDID